MCLSTALWRRGLQVLSSGSSQPLSYQLPSLSHHSLPSYLRCSLLLQLSMATAKQLAKVSRLCGLFHSQAVVLSWELDTGYKQSFRTQYWALETGLRGQRSSSCGQQHNHTIRGSTRFPQLPWECLASSCCSAVHRSTIRLRWAASECRFMLWSRREQITSRGSAATWAKYLFVLGTVHTAPMDWLMPVRSINHTLQPRASQSV